MRLDRSELRLIGGVRSFVRTGHSGPVGSKVVSMSDQGALLSLLKALIAADHVAIEAYRVAVGTLANEGARATLSVFMRDHEQHVERLSAFILDLGERPPSPGDFLALFAKARVMFGNVVGDAGILAAMRSNEDDSNDAYERALETPGVPASVRRVLELHLADERRHRGWIEDQIRERRRSTMPPPAFESP